MIRFQYAGKTYCSETCRKYILAAEQQERRRQRNLDRQLMKAEKRLRVQAERQLKTEQKRVQRLREKQQLEKLHQEYKHVEDDMREQINSLYKAARGNTEPLAANPYAPGYTAREQTGREKGDD